METAGVPGVSPAHTPYDDTSRPFTIGLKPLDLADWIEVDENYDAHLVEKRRLYATIPDMVFVEEPDTRDAQQEVLAAITAHLRAEAERICPGPPERASVAAALAGMDGIDDATPPLRRASLLVQEDLILMRRGDDGWRLAAGSLCFASSWSLVEKFGKPLDEIHRPVPGFAGGSRNAELINRMFDKLHQPVIRYNWSVQAGDDLYRPLSGLQRDERARDRPSKFPNGDIDANAFIRVERQTLRKLPVSGDILFTIRIFLDPLRILARHPDRRRLAASFAAQLAALDESELDYKGLTADSERLVELLTHFAAD